jgi:hypothetical protein
MFCNWVRFGTKIAQKELFDKKQDSGQPEGGKSRLRAATRWLGKQDEQTLWFIVYGSWASATACRMKA